MLSLVLQVGACKKINMLYLRHLFRCQRSIINVLAVAAICSAPKETMTPSPLACPTFLLLTFGDAMRTPYNLFCSAGGRSWPTAALPWLGGMSAAGESRQPTVEPVSRF
jgi:hypothetical protein